MSANLVKIVNEQAITNSLLVAQKFEKEHKHVTDSIKELLRSAENSTDLEKDSLKIEEMFIESIYLDSYNREQPMYIMNRDGFSLLAMGFTGAKALKFKLDFIKEFNKMEKELKKALELSLKQAKLSVSSSDPNIIKSKIMVARFYIQTCKPNENTKLMLMNEIANPVGLSLPDYTTSKDVLRSASELLKINESTLTARQFNQLLIQKGFLIENSRPSNSKNSKNGKSYFKTLIGKGLKYGENQASIHNPKETQPLYYESKFIELLELLNLKQSA